MKNLVKSSLLITAILIGFASNTFGQSSATASSTAILVTPLSISKVDDMSFATLASSGTVVTAVIDPVTGIMAVTPIGALISGTGVDAAFTVLGKDDESIYVSMNTADIVLTHNGTGPSILVDDVVFSWNGDGAVSFPNTVIMTTTNPDILTVGGTLTIPSNTLAGTYSNSSVIITVNYN